MDVKSDWPWKEKTWIRLPLGFFSNSISFKFYFYIVSIFLCLLEDRIFKEVNDRKHKPN